MKILPVLIGIFLAVNAEKSKFDNYRVYSVNIENEEQYKVMKYIEENSDAYNFWSDPGVKTQVEILVPPHKFNDFEEIMTKYSMKSELYIKNLQSLIDLEQAAIAQRDISKSMDWTSYYRMQEIYDWLDQMAASYPQYMNVTTIGFSYEKRPIKLVTISKKAGNRAIAFESTIHAREWISPATATYLINQLLTSSDPDIVEVSTNVDWYFIPFANPDGYEFTWTNNRNWRKTRSPVSMLCWGVDGNRNFAYNWLWPDETGNEGGSRVPCTDTYSGAYPYSEPETVAIEGFLNAQAWRIDTYIALHSYGHLFLHPWGHTIVPPETVNELGGVGRAGRDAIRAVNGIEYTVGSSNGVLYASTGTSRDHTFGYHKIPITFTLEMRGNGPYGNYGFVLPPNLIMENVQEVTKGIIALIREARTFGRFPVN